MLRRAASHSLALLSLLAGLHAAWAQPRTPLAAGDLSVEDASAYAFDRPEATYPLPSDLKEISGLTVLDDRHLGAVQDEDGVLFIINFLTGDVEAARKFGKDGDYEGIELAGSRLFVLRSDGTIYEIADWRAKTLDAKKHRTALSAACDAEGLAYEASRKRLLVACKERAGKGLKHRKAIYAFDLSREKLLDAPAYTIAIRAFNARTADDAISRRIRLLLEPVADLSGFKPSGVAVHPLTKQVYVLSSARKALVAMEADGTLAEVWALPDALFAQPEGIAFLPNGDLFIANEGVSGAATLLRFTYQPDR